MKIFFKGILDPRQGASTPRQDVPFRRGIVYSHFGLLD